MKRWCSLIGLVAVCTTALASPVRLDDSLTHTVPPNVQMQWRPLQGAAGPAGSMEAWVRVNVRVDTAAWAGQSGRVYMVLARDSTSVVEASWTTQGRLLAGRVLSGERTLVYAGSLPAALSDQLAVRLRASPDWDSPARRLNFHFELETP
ncbi:hypothetical protein [Hydrogenophaga sp. R2]|uniref:hypothetical protein n=1 Tax=Hydrogenophaga sp. R2 TaxID=3132827 RepID=UPI003CF269DC